MVRTEVHTTQFRIYSRKPGEPDFRFRRFTGSQVTADQPRAEQNLARARHDTPDWEFRLARRELRTLTFTGDWVIDSAIADQEA